MYATCPAACHVKVLPITCSTARHKPQQDGSEGHNDLPGKRWRGLRGTQARVPRPEQGRQGHWAPGEGPFAGKGVAPGCLVGPWMGGHDAVSGPGLLPHDLEGGGSHILEQLDVLRDDEVGEVQLVPHIQGAAGDRDRVAWAVVMLLCGGSVVRRHSSLLSW